MLTREDLDAAVALVGEVVPPTPQYRWPRLCEALGTEVWLKHEDQTPTGAFKVRGGVVYVDDVRRRRDAGEAVAGIASATRGNHGQSLALSGARLGVPVLVGVPEGNSADQNSAIRAHGAELLVAGADFEETRVEVARAAAERGYELVPAFHPLLVAGVATYWHEFFTAVPDLDVVYVAVGMGSGICAAIEVRDLLGLGTDVVGVVTEGAPTWALSVEAGRVVPTERARTWCDGVATRNPPPEAFEVVRGGAARVIQVSDEQAADACRMIFDTTHHVAEGAAGVVLAGAVAEREQLRGLEVGTVLCGANVDRDVFRQVLAGGTPAA